MHLNFTSCLAPDTHPFWGRLTSYLSARLGLPIRFIAEELPWPERLRRLQAGNIDMGWVCGSYYVRWQREAETQVALLAAPVMAAARYADRPIYFSEVVVSTSSPFQSFADLRGVRWAINEPGSHSGYGMVAAHLAAMGEDWGYFGSVVVSGAHHNSLALILAGEVDAAAIDSIVLETALRADPTLSERLRVVAVLGPSPIPPLVVHQRLPMALRRQVRALLLTMHCDPVGSEVLADGHVARFAAVTDEDYEPLRRCWF